MTIVKQISLFDIHELYEMEPIHRFDAIFSTFDIQPLFHLFSKKAMKGAPRELNYGAMIQSLIARIVGRIPTIKDLVNRLKMDPFLRLACGFLHSDIVPSEAAYSRMIHVISQSDILGKMQDQLIQLAMVEGFLDDKNIAIDATHFEARDAQKPSPKKEKLAPKKRGRKSKEEQEQWLQEKLLQEANLTLYQKEIKAQLNETTATLWQEAPITPMWGIKRNSEGENLAWYGFKAHLAVSTKSQYIICGLMTSANLNDSKAAIPLLKKVQTLFPHHFSSGIFDAGYDYAPIYEQLQALKLQAVIPYNVRNEGEYVEYVGFDGHFAPTCVREHSYRYDSYDKQYETLKYTQPKECITCPLQHESLCQKVFKIKCETDLRKYTNPARGSEKWIKLYKERSAVERTNAYLKGYFQLNNVRHRSGKKEKCHFQLITLIYNASKLAVHRINKVLREQPNVA
ncbi:transposase [Viridibacillus sp. YIM B01967]|uniref:Transposase n=1 Tax=Viridibacillus soli TaxID=2798301 RepID=A0ABS1HAM6_9BACL|nr:transposase [Viridibacillus soli]MBK3496465.1 transposase [Viridibacillus soli]